MGSLREKIKMSADELAKFLDDRRTISVATIGRDGWPHVMALWYVMRDGNPWVWTYAKSQKVRNLERDPRATLMAEDGQSYDELRGVMLKTEAKVYPDFDTVLAAGEEIYAKYTDAGRAGGNEALREGLKSQAAKRVAVQFKVLDTVSWDHRKLAG